VYLSGLLASDSGYSNRRQFNKSYALKYLSSVQADGMSMKRTGGGWGAAHERALALHVQCPGPKRKKKTITGYIVEAGFKKKQEG
jgi:hypothetical protein